MFLVILAIVRNASLLKCLTSALCKKKSVLGVILIRIFPDFPAFGLNTERYGVSLLIQSKCGKNADQNNSEYGLFLGSVWALISSHCTADGCSTAVLAGNDTFLTEKITEDRERFITQSKHIIF